MLENIRDTEKLEETIDDVRLKCEDLFSFKHNIT